jgi:hypothetical protein
VDLELAIWAGATFGGGQIVSADNYVAVCIDDFKAPDLDPL